MEYFHLSACVSGYFSSDTFFSPNMDRKESNMLDASYLFRSLYVVNEDTFWLGKFESNSLFTYSETCVCY